MRTRRIADVAQLNADPTLAAGVSKLAALLRGRRHFRRSEIPGRDGEPAIPFVWVVCSGAQKQEAIAGAVGRFTELGIPAELRLGTDLEDETGWQILAMAMRDPDDPGTDANPYPRPLAPVSLVRETLTVDERDILLSEYMDLEEEVDPDPLKMSEAWHAQIEAAILKKTPDEGVRELSGFGSRTLIGYMLSTVRPLLISRIGKFESSQSASPDSSSNPPPEPEPDPGEPMKSG